jgi:hypothetical protein
MELNPKTFSVHYNRSLLRSTSAHTRASFSKNWKLDLKLLIWFNSFCCRETQFCITRACDLTNPKSLESNLFAEGTIKMANVGYQPL